MGNWSRSVLLSAAVMLAAGPLWAAPADAADPVPLCFGQVATIVGTDGDDTLTGTTGVDVILALGGDDVIQPAFGSDRVCAGAGDDVMAIEPSGPQGFIPGDKDLVSGGPGNDRLEAADNGGGNHILGGKGRDQLIATRADILEGGDGNDDLYGVQGSALLGQDGDDHLIGLGDLVAYGGDGNDIYQQDFAAPGTQRFFGGSGDDIATMTPRFDTENQGEVAEFFGGPGKDYLYGGRNADLLRGGRGDDWLAGRQGPDQLYGGPDADTLFGGRGADLCRSPSHAPRAHSC